MFHCTLSCSEARITLLGWLIKLVAMNSRPGIVWGFPSLVGISLVIWSTQLATSSIPRYSDIELSVLSRFLPTRYLSVQRGRRPFQATCLFCHCCFYFPFISAPMDCPHFQWMAGWFVVWNRRFTVRSSACHPVSCPRSWHSIIVCDQIIIFIIDDRCALLVGFCRVIQCVVGLFAVSCFHAFLHGITPLLYTIIFG